MEAEIKRDLLIQFAEDIVRRWESIDADVLAFQKAHNATPEQTECLLQMMKEMGGGIETYEKSKQFLRDVGEASDTQKMGE
jgi:hypothetical protein